MKESQRRTLETIALVSEAALILFLSTWAFSQRQRKWIKDRDDNRCQAPFPHKEDLEHPLHVHHILPQGYCNRVGVEPDFPENGITLCQNAHDVIHPDVPEARHEYSQDHGSFGKLREKRAKKLDQRKIYWVDKFDRLMQVIALRRTQEKKKNFDWPE